MQTKTIPVITSAALREKPGSTDYKDIEEYYTTAGPDYKTWDKDFNMHFGYCRRFSDIFSLKKMLVNMNEEVLQQLQINPAHNCHVIDLGCGMATVARQAALKFPKAKIKAVTIVDYQVSKGRQINKEQNLQGRVTVLRNNFEDLDFNNSTFSHAYAIESACHASGHNKELFIAELARVLQSGGRFCIADGFLKNNGHKPSFFNWLYKRVSNYWAVPCFATIDDFENTLKAYGLKNIRVKEISYRIAPSVFYVPLICIKFFFTEIWKNKSLRMKKERWNNVYAPLLGMVMGLYRKHFGYYIVSGEK